MSKVAFTIKLEKKNPHDLVRNTWGNLRPTSRVVESKKAYNRKNAKRELKAMCQEW